MWKWGGMWCGEMGEEEHLRWFGYVQRMENEAFVKKVYLSSIEGSSRRGRPHGRLENWVKEYLSESGVRGNGLKWARRECMDRKRWRSFCCGNPLGGTLLEGVRLRSY